MSRRGWVGWVEEHRGTVAGLVFWTVISLTVGTAVVNGAGAPSEEGSGQVAGNSQPVGVATPAPVATGNNGTPLPFATGGAGSNSVPTIPGGAPFVPGTSPVPPCRPGAPRAANGQPETGITGTSIRVGQIVTDASNITGQFRPTYEGLSAYFALVNARGGVCGRKITIDYDNDNSNPSTHDFNAMAQRDFAFVANFTILDQLDYDQNPPFNPKYRDSRTGEFVPDVGGLAFSYNRSQSAWHAGVIGSVSPVLVGGGQFKYFLQEAADEKKPCRKAGTIALVEPTGASQDQARVGGAALAASWGGGLGAANVKSYSAALASPDLVYRGIIERMVRDGVNCVFSYTDLASNINLAKALSEEGVWPPDKCSRPVKSQCFSVVWVPFTAYDPSFVRSGGAGARDVSTFIPQLPINETSNPAMKAYLDALSTLKKTNGAFRDAQPSAFSALGYASGIMFVEALTHCGGAPTRRCVMTYLRGVKDFGAGGLLGGVTPFRTTRTYAQGYGTWSWKWIFFRSIAVRVLGNESNYLYRWHRIRPSAGFFSDTLHVAR
jgi:branched-chain amino acid transport system substrate-binding protein